MSKRLKLSTKHTKKFSFPHIFIAPYNSRLLIRERCLFLYKRIQTNFFVFSSSRLRTNQALLIIQKNKYQIFRKTERRRLLLRELQETVTLGKHLKSTKRPDNSSSRKKMRKQISFREHPHTKKKGGVAQRPIQFTK
jgi:hypothetical protein